MAVIGGSTTSALSRSSPYRIPDSAQNPATNSVAGGNRTGPVELQAIAPNTDPTTSSHSETSSRGSPAPKRHRQRKCPRTPNARPARNTDRAMPTDQPHARASAGLGTTRVHATTRRQALGESKSAMNRGSEAREPPDWTEPTTVTTTPHANPRSRVQPQDPEQCGMDPMDLKGLSSSFGTEFLTSTQRDFEFQEDTTRSDEVFNETTMNF